jgi:hypothetical protein
MIEIISRKLKTKKVLHEIEKGFRTLQRIRNPFLVSYDPGFPWNSFENSIKKWFHGWAFVHEISIQEYRIQRSLKYNLMCSEQFYFTLSFYPENRFKYFINFWYRPFIVQLILRDIIPLMKLVLQLSKWRKIELIWLKVVLFTN